MKIAYITQNVIYQPTGIYIYSVENRTGDVMVSVLTSSVVDCGFSTRSCQSKDLKLSKRYRLVEILIYIYINIYCH
jgi:hypothetical protein